MPRTATGRGPGRPPKVQAPQSENGTATPSKFATVNVFRSTQAILKQVSFTMDEDISVLADKVVKFFLDNTPDLDEEDRKAIRRLARVQN